MHGQTWTTLISQYIATHVTLSKGSNIIILRKYQYVSIALHVWHSYQHSSINAKIA